MKRKTKKRIYDVIFDIWCVVWFFLPVSLGPGVIGSENTPLTLYPFMMPYYLYENGFSTISLFLFPVYLIPVYGFAKLVLAFNAIFPSQKKRVTLFIDNSSGFFSTLARIIATLIMFVMLILPILFWADYENWFTTYPIIGIVSFVVVLVLNLFAMYFFFQYFTVKKASYAEYKTFSEANKNNPVTHAEFLFKIRTKLFIAFVGLIAIILVSLSLLILNQYKKTIMELVEETAHSHVVQAAAAYRINLGDTIAMSEYMNRHMQLNNTADFPYKDISIYTSLKESIYIDQIPDQFDRFKTEFSTRDPATRFPDIPPLDGNIAHNWLSLYNAGSSIPVQTNKENDTYYFVEPILKTDSVKVNGERVKRQRLLGFSVISFSKDIIMRSFFKTRISVFVCTGLFLYIAVQLTYLIGNYIVNPIQFLRMNVRKIADILSGMMSGVRRVSSSQLVYQDPIKSRDEIKSLSGEFSNMVGVIRGIIPYISASTLKQAEIGAAATEKKSLTFLFTDIRGFTTLCEGLPPEEVVDILNHYLDLETEIILNNHGDIDKFVGDEMMAFFDGSDKELNACRAAMEIRTAMMAEREQCLKTGKPVIEIGIGINTGEVVFGSVGARDRRDFTSIGDTVNLAARLEGANKAYNSKTILTDAVYQKISAEFTCRELDFITVKGKTEPVRIYELLQLTTRARPKITDIKNIFEQGLTAYRNQDWDTAAAFFQKNIDTYSDRPSAVFLDRVAHFQKNAPSSDWDGVFRMTVK